MRYLITWLTWSFVTIVLTLLFNNEITVQKCMDVFHLVWGAGSMAGVLYFTEVCDRIYVYVKRKGRSWVRERIISESQLQVVLNDLARQKTVVGVDVTHPDGSEYRGASKFNPHQG